MLLSRGLLEKKMMKQKDGPYMIKAVYPNGTVKLMKGVTSQKVSI